MTDTILDYLPRGKGMVHRCIICGGEFTGRRNRRLCGNPPCLSIRLSQTQTAAWARGVPRRYPRNRKHHRWGTLECAVCHQTARRHNAVQVLCGKRSCKKTYNRERWRRKKSDYVNSGKRPMPKPTLAALPAPRCGCGNPLRFGSDPMTGASLEWCPQCGERPMALIGKRQYDQRERLERELRAKQESAESPVEIPGKSGDAFRQESHKRGAA